MSGNYRKAVGCRALSLEDSDESAGRRALAAVSAAGDDHFPCDSWGPVDVFDGMESVDRDALEGLTALETEEVIPELCDSDVIPPEPSEDQALAAELESLLSGAEESTEQDRRDYLIDDAPDVLTVEKVDEFVSALLETYGPSHSAKVAYVMKYAVPKGGLEKNGYNKDILVSAIETIALTGKLSIQDRVELVRDAYEQVLDRSSALRLGMNVINAVCGRGTRAEKQSLASVTSDASLNYYSRDDIIDRLYSG